MDEPGWTLWDGTTADTCGAKTASLSFLHWRRGPTLYVSGSNQRRFCPRFDAVGLLSAPADEAKSEGALARWELHHAAVVRGAR
jgi:hypothetical protein